MNPRRILLVRLSALGDVVNTLPSLSALREAYPSVHLGFAVEDRCAGVVEGHPAVDSVHVYPRRRWDRMRRRPWLWLDLLAEAWTYLRGIRGQDYDVVLDFQGNLKGALHSRFSGAGVRVGYARGYCKEGNWLFSNRRAEPATPRQNRVEKFLGLLAPLGVFPRAIRYQLPEPASSRDRVAAWLRGEGLAPGAYAVLHPGTSEAGRLKRWPAERFAEVARGLPGPSVVTWGPSERALAGEVVAASGGAARLGPETSSLTDLSELLRAARLFVGADSGPLHLASAAGTPSVALFGPKDPAVYAPWNPRSRVLYRPGRVDEISAAEVVAAARELWP